jgi:outer membrane protein TolC
VAFQATQKGYLSGIKNLTDLLQSQEALARARSDQVEAYRKSKTAWAQMLYAIGGLSFDELARPRPTVTVLK